jgi:hypothetical protein
VAVAGCGTTRETRSKPMVAQSPFAHVHPAAAPATWHAAVIPTGAVLSYPPDWTRAESDPGTATAVRDDARKRIVGYLNVTPRQAGESLSDWPAFRVRHNTQEGDRAVALEASAYRVRFLTGTGSCVRDSYTTVSGARYEELACLVRGGSTTSVIVAAAMPARWTQISPVLYRALSAFKT